MIHILIRMLHWLYLRLKHFERARSRPRPAADVASQPMSVNQRAAREMLRRYLRGAGYETITDFAEQHPRLTMDALGRELGLPVNTYWAIGANLLREAEEYGTVEHYVRSLIVRDLCNRSLATPHPNIRNSGPSSEFEKSLIAVATSLPHRYKAGCYRVALAYSMTPIAYAWSPLDADDINLQELFSYWDASSIAVRDSTLAPDMVSVQCV